MRHVLVISSYVAKGTVGLQATLPAFLSHVLSKIVPIAVPTIVLSNHPGFKACAGAPIAPETLDLMLDAFDKNGWLSEIDAVMTGYLPSASHVAFAERTVTRVRSRSRDARYLADPVIGDDPAGLYVGKDTATAVRDRLLPPADIITPNRFELAWLSEMPVNDGATAVAAARALRVPAVVATSVPDDGMRLSNVLVTHDTVYTRSVDRLEHAPHGTGDYFAGAFLAHSLSGAEDVDALTAATHETAHLLKLSGMGGDLATYASQPGAYP